MLLVSKCTTLGQGAAGPRSRAPAVLLRWLATFPSPDCQYAQTAAEQRHRHRFRYPDGESDTVDLRGIAAIVQVEDRVQVDRLYAAELEGPRVLRAGEITAVAE